MQLLFSQINSFWNFFLWKVLKIELDQERMKIQHQSDKLRIHEKELIVAKDELRKREIEVNSQVQDVKIATENKYRVIMTYLSSYSMILFYSHEIVIGCARRKISNRNGDLPKMCRNRKPVDFGA
jgi:hypothetical protein